MCGIAGFAQGSGLVSGVSILSAMNQALYHRGPDEGGEYRWPREGGEPQIGLAMRRLAIIDLATGQQPMCNETGDLWIVYNGEIYNHRELRVELEAAGHTYRTRCDTETILHAYEEWGPDCLNRLRGMFGIAIWDERRRMLFLARDQVGIKPLYWTSVGAGIAFGSEIKALLRFPGVRREVDPQALHDYLTFLYAPPPRTLFAGIRQLPPGHYLTWSPDQPGAPTVTEYWTAPQAFLEPPATKPVSLEEAWEVLKDSVQAHLLSDVPLGAFLSGGLDSSLIVALMAELATGPVETFCVGFEAAGLYDERAFARSVANHLGTRHHELTVDASDVALLPRIVRHLDEPLADASVIPNYLVAGLARRHVKVALSGAGGDELFGGYRRYYGNSLAQKLERVPGVLRNQVLLPALRRIPAVGDTRLGDASRLAQKLLEPLDLPPEERYLAWNSFFSPAAKQQLYAGGRLAGLPASTDQMLGYFQVPKGRDFADRAMYVDLKSYLPGDPLFLSDRMTMAHSLEARVPLVDVPVMEFAARLPLEQKVKNQETKVLLRQLLRRRVPEEIVNRPKRGFGTPIDVWMRGALRPLLDQALAPEVLERRGYFNPEYVTWMMHEQFSGRRDFSQHLWALFLFEIWHRMYIDADLSQLQNPTFADLGFRAADLPVSSREP